MAARKDLVIQQGKTFTLVVRWEAPPVVYKQITAVAKSAPVRMTVEGHGAVNGWRCAVTNVVGMTQINAASDPNKLHDRDYHSATVIDVDTVEFNDVNAAGFYAYVSGGILQYNTPVDLNGMTARMDVKDAVGGTVLTSLTTENGGIAIDNVKKQIVLTLNAAATALFDWTEGVYDLEMVSADVIPVVTVLLTGSVSVVQEVTT